MKSVGDPESLERLHNDMSYKDWFMALLMQETILKLKYVLSMIIKIEKHELRRC